MKSVAIAVGRAALAAALSVLFVPAAHADSLTPTPFSVPGPARPPLAPSQMNSRQIAVYVSKGIPRARAAQAVALQHKVMRAEVIGKMETALGTGFAGVWFEPAAARFDVAVSSPASRRAAERVIQDGHLASLVTLTSVRSSWAELQAAQKQWNRRLADLLAGANAQTSLSAPQNAVVVTLSSSVPRSRRVALRRAASAASVNVRITIAPDRSVGGLPAGEKTECAKFVTYAANCNKPLTSGVTIEKEEEEKFCTAGPMAIPNANVNETYLLTAGHCGLKGNSFGAYNKNGEKHEIGKAATMVFNKTGDYGYIPIENAEWKEAGNEPLFAVTAQWKFNAERSYRVIRQGRIGTGGVTCHDGQTSGGTCGDITATSATWTYGGQTVEGLVTVAGPELVIEKGDSGGPFFFSEENREVLMQGLTVVKALGTVKEGGFMPLGPVLTALSAELLTKNNENRALYKEEKEHEEGGLATILSSNEQTNWTGKNVGEETFEAAGGTKIKCTSEKTEGTLNPDKDFGSLHADFEGCQDTSLGLKCKSTGDATGVILMSGWWKSVIYEKEPELGGALLFEPTETHIECAPFVKATLKGDILCPVSSPKTLTTTHEFHCEGEKGKTKHTEYYNGKSEKVKIATLLVSINSGAFEEAALIGSGTQTFPEAVEIMA